MSLESKKLEIEILEKKLELARLRDTPIAGGDKIQEAANHSEPVKKEKEVITGWPLLLVFGGIIILLILITKYDLSLDIASFNWKGAFVFFFILAIVVMIISTIFGLLGKLVKFAHKK